MLMYYWFAPTPRFREAGFDVSDKSSRLSTATWKGSKDTLPGVTPPPINATMSDFTMRFP